MHGGRVLLGAFVILVGCAGAADSDRGGAQTLGSNDSTGDSSSSTASPTVSSTTGGDSDDDAESTADSETGAETSSGSGGPDSTDTGETSAGVESWHRYTLDTTTGAWSTTPLDELWQGANAPPPTDIDAAMSLTHFDRLWIVGADGTFYEQADGIWLEPVPIATRFPMTAGLQIGAMTHTPSQMDTSSEDVFFIDNPTAVIYTQHANGGLDLVQVATLEDEADAAPQGSGRAAWYFAITDPPLAGMDPDWLQWYVAYDDGNLWRFNAAFEWSSEPIGNNAFLTGGPGEPDPATIEAAYYDDVFERVHFIAP